MDRIDTISQHVVGFLGWRELAVWLRVTRAANTPKESIWKTKLNTCQCVRGICIARDLAKLENLSPHDACKILAGFHTTSVLGKLEENGSDLHNTPARALVKVGFWLINNHRDKARDYFAYIVSRPALLSDLWRVRLSGVECRTLQHFLATQNIFEVYCAWSLKQWTVVANFEFFGEEYSFVYAWCCVAFWHLGDFSKSVQCGRRAKKPMFALRYTVRSHISMGDIALARKLLENNVGRHPFLELELAYFEARVGDALRAYEHLFKALHLQMVTFPFDWNETIDTVCNLIEED